MYYTGFADEASSDIDGQIKAIKALGWNCLEARSIDGVNIHDIPEEKFELVCHKLKEANIYVNCFGSTIANWSKNITDPFEETLVEVKRAIPRMQKLGTKMIRIMSYAVLKDKSPDEQMFEERVKRLQYICKIFLDNGIIPVHENCMNYGGMGWTYTLKLIEKVPGLKLVFDTGNPIFTDDRTKPFPYPKQSSWEFYSYVREYVVYVHIKDGRMKEDKKNPGRLVMEFTYPGEGDGNVREIIRDLLKRGYDGGLSIEPHMAIVHHDKSKVSSDDEKFKIFVEYGKKLMKIVEEEKSMLKAK